MQLQAPADTSPGPQKSWLRAWLSPRRLRFWLLVVVLLYALAGFFLAPWLIGRTAAKTFSETGRSLELGAVRVNPFALSIALRDLDLRDTDGEAILALDSAYLNFQLSSLFRRAWTFREFRIDGPFVNLERFGPGDDRIGNLVRALAPAGSREQQDRKEPEGLPRLIVQLLDCSNGRVVFTDHLEEEVFRAESGPININVSNFSTLPDDKGNKQIHIAMPSGGSVVWSGELQVSPLRSQGRVTVSGQASADGVRYLNLLLPFTVQTGDMDLALDYRFAIEPSGEPGLEVKNLTGEVDDVVLKPEDAGKDVLRVPKLRFEGGVISLAAKTAGLQKLTINGTELNIARLPDGGLDLQRLLAATAVDEEQLTEPAAVEASAHADPANGWTVDLQEVLVSDASVRFEDRTLDPTGEVALHGVNLTALGISNRPGASFPAHVDFELSEGGAFSFDGEAAALPEFSASGKVSLNGANLAGAQPWIGGIAHVTVKSGTASLSGQIAHSPQETVAYQGSLQVNALKVDDASRDEPLLGLESLDIERVEFSLAQRSAETSLIQLTRPYGRIAIAPDRTTNLNGLIVPTEQDQDQIEQAPQAKPFSIKLDGFDVKDGSLDYSDRALPLPFSAAIRSLGGTISTLSSTSSEPAQVQLEGQVNEYGLARISGTINVWSPTDNADLKVVFRNLETARLTPYTIGFAGYKIDDGRLDLDLDYQIKRGQMQGDNKIISRQLRLGEKVETKDGGGLPLQLAVALLTDSNGVIDLDLPVSGDINDPEFRLGGVIAKAIAGLIGKIVTSPFRLLGKLVGVDSKDFGSLSFVPGSAGISPPDREKLAKLAEAMQQRPELVLGVAGVYAADADRAALQAKQLDSALEARMESERQGSDELSGTMRRRATEALFQQSFPDITLASVQAEYMREAKNEDGSPAQPVLDETAYLAGLRQRLIEKQQVTDEQLNALASARADAVIAELQGAAAGSALPVNRAEAEMAEAASSGEILLELRVSVAKGSR